ncbi:MAG: hypothetical protein AAGA93_02130 [Actinomycetota bacterium]
MTMIETAKDLQARYLDGVKTAQEQIVSYNERIADTVSGALPEFQTPLAEYLPSPAEVVETYYAFVGEMYEANKEFASRMVAAWERTEDAPAAKETTKAAAKKATKK